LRASYYALEYEKMIGVDFSASMLDEASKRISERKCDNISLIQVDDKNFWDKLESSFDRITAALNNRPNNILGFSHNPDAIRKISQNYSENVTMQRSKIIS